MRGTARASRLPGLCSIDARGTLSVVKMSPGIAKCSVRGKTPPIPLSLKTAVLEK